MQQSKINRLLSGVVAILVMLLMTTAIILPISAQSAPFATNTPVGDGVDSAPSDAPANETSGLTFATNTPEGITAPVDRDQATTQTGPQALLFNYALHQWLEPDFVNLTLDQIMALEAGDDEAQLATNLLLYEMEQRFPTAPRDPAQRQEMIAAMLRTPVGALDMRQLVRPFVQDAIDDNPSASLIESNGFDISLIPANLDGSGELDRVVNVVYQDEAGIRYEEYLLATANADGSYTLATTTYDLPAVPFDGIHSVTMDYLRDVNADTLDELVLRVADSEASERLLIVKYRNGNAVDIIDPSLQLRVGEIVSWPVEGETTTAPALTVLEYQAVSEYPDWQCLNQIEYTWVYERNLYRRTQDLNARFSNVDSMGCTLANADLFSLPTNEAITMIEMALLDYGFEAPSTQRALMTLSMLYVLSGRLDDARNTAQTVVTADDDSSWESRQASALIRATNASGNTALDICEAVAMANEFPACDMNAVIGTYLDAITLTTDTDLEEQLNAVGLPVNEQVVINEIGRAPRTTVLFNYFDSGWWGFYDTGDGVYQFESAEPPIGFTEPSFPMPALAAPQSAVDALLIDNDPIRVLAIFDNLMRENPNTPLGPSALYVQALAAEFTGDRNSARATYYDIWQIYPDRIWGDIAAAHLEQR